MLRLALTTVSAQARRLVAPGLAIVLGVMFVAATLVLSTTLVESARAAAGHDVGRYAVIVRPDESPDRTGPSVESGTLPSSLFERLAGVPTVQRVEGLHRISVMMGPNGPGGAGAVAVEPPDDPRVRVSAGRLPSGADEVAVTTSVAARLALTVGSTVPVAATTRSVSAERPLTVVGVVDTSRSVRYAAYVPYVFAPSATLVALAGNDAYGELRIIAKDGSDPSVVKAAVAPVVAQSAPGATAYTGKELADAAADKMAGDKAMTTMLLAFAVVALFVAALVIANTFTILLARRSRDSALLRLVGASRAQLARSALVEAVIVGAVFSVIGVGGGIAACWGFTRIFGEVSSIPLSQLGVRMSDVLTPMCLGVLVTVAAAAVPVWRATRVAPIAALRPQGPINVTARAGRIRLFAGFAAIGLGAGLVWLGSGGDIQAGLAGGMLSFLGVLATAVVLMPGIVRIVGAIPRRFLGIPGELAVQNCARNPRRTAATMSALLVGVTLVATMLVGAATAKASIGRALDQAYAVDLEIAAETPLAQATIAKAIAVPGVVSSARLRSASVTLPGGITERAVGVPADAVGVFRDGGAVTHLAAGTVSLNPERARASGLADGQRILLSGKDSRSQFVVHIAGAQENPVTVGADDLLRLDRSAPVTGLAVRLSDSADLPEVVGSFEAAVAGTGAHLQGSAPQRAEITKILDLVLLIVSGLLGVSVLIAVVGVANTLSLSALERTQESALLRALGLTRGQLRSALAVEAVLLAFVATLVGLGLGTFYGASGISSVLLTGTRRTAIDVALPWGQFAAIAVAAVAAGLLASVLPSRRAARIAPAAALAIE